MYDMICVVMKVDYRNKTIIITGAYRGIGKKISEFFAMKGAKLVITYHIHKKETDLLKEELFNKYNVNVDSVYLDLKDENTIIDLLNYVKNKYQKIDVLVNNAAISLDSHILDKTKEEFMDVIEINLVGTFLMMKYFNDIMDNGYIFNISSTDGVDTGNIYSVDYNASKAGVNSLTKTFSLYTNNKVISICPNWVDTESTNSMLKGYLESELKRIGQKKLIDVSCIPKVIDECIKNNVLSGSIIMVEGERDNG